MKADFPTRFVGGAFIAAAAMLWLGWLLMPVHVGTYFVADDFARIAAQFHFWIWMYRVHLFGLVVTAMALVALGSQLTNSEARAVAWPGIFIAAAGLVVSALAAAFYYHHGAWGAQKLAGKSSDAVLAFIDALLVDTEYVTCLVRFGRVFSGLGMFTLGWALIQWRLLPPVIAGGAALIGLASMAITMAMPDHLHLYLPVFHLLALWLAVTGVVILRAGLSGVRK
jgi:hypothetical protein